VFEGNQGHALVQRYLPIGKYIVNPIFCHASKMSSLRYYEAVRAEIIRLLKQERERRKLSRYAVSQRSGVSQTMLSRVERGLRNPTLELVLRIADGIGTDLPAVIKKAQRTAKRGGRVQG
jgi:DNA-binding XRE family transcriptional regulator